MPDQTEHTFSPLIIGTMRLGSWGADLNSQQMETFVEGCLALGLRDVDHADIYGDHTTEAQFGEILRGNSSLRQRLCLITKCGIKNIQTARCGAQLKSYDLSAEHIMKSVEQSLLNFHTDSIDVLLLHRPDLLMDPEEIAGICATLREQGKVRAFGVSNFSPTQFDLLHREINLITHQVEMSPLRIDAFEDGTLDQCLRYRVRPMAWSPLAGGRLFARDGREERVRRIVEATEELAERHCTRIDRVLLAWLLRHPAKIIPVLGTSKLERVRAAYEATAIELTREDWYRLWRASTGSELP